MLQELAELEDPEKAVKSGGTAASSSKRDKKAFGNCEFTMDRLPMIRYTMS
jgi:hypothetical protein